MPSIQQLMTERIYSGLKRSAIKSPSTWAETYRQMKSGKWSFKHHPWLKEMHDSKSEYNVGQKCAQVGFTELLLNLTFYGIDIKGFDCLYILPNKRPDASLFSSGRFAPALSLSPHLTNLFTDNDNVDHKRAGSANLYVAGSQSRSGLKGLPINYLFMDEVAEFEQKNIPLAFARTDGQKEKLIWMISTPTMEGFGISEFYNQTDKRHFFFKCPSCSRSIELKFPESLLICGDDENDPRVNDSQLICYECKAYLPHELKAEWQEKNEWVKTIGQRDWSGYTISQMYSHEPIGRPSELAKFYFRSKYHPATEVEFYNSKLGVEHIPTGAKVQDIDIDYCIVNGPVHRMSDKLQTDNNNIMTMGVDVGPQIIHYEITKYRIDWSKFQSDVNNCAYAIVVKHGKVKTYEELYKLMNEYRIRSCVIDANPERRKAAEFAKKFFGRVKLCIFGNNVQGKTYVDSKVEVNSDPIILVDRTTWLDQALGRFANHTISLPIDTDIEYKMQIKEPVKQYKQDVHGNPTATYMTKASGQDHYAFARCYSEIALMFGASLNINQDM